MNKLITIKGSNNGLQLFIAENATFEEVHQSLIEKLSSSANFFIKNTSIYWIKPSFPKHQQEILTALFKKYDILLKINTPLLKDKSINTMQKKESFPDKIINRTIRGGEEIVYKGSIVIYGNVNPGSKIIAGGNIDIHGGCRGVVHAGAFGDTRAFIIADNLAPLQIRIADFIARSPDNIGEHIASTITEKAIIKDGNIILEPFNR